MSVTQFSLAEAFANITGLETIERLGTIMVKDSGSWVPVSSQAVQQTVQQSGFKFLGNSVTGGNVVSSIGQPQVAKSVWGITEAYTGRCFATPTQLSPGIQAALSNTGRAQVGSTALQPITRMEIVQSTGGEILETQAKGILTKIPMKAAMRACAAAQGIMLGIDIVETNPRFCTQLSNALFRTEIDPDNIAAIVDNTTVWANIKDGVCFLAEDFINAVRFALIDSGILTAQNTHNAVFGDINLNDPGLEKSGRSYANSKNIRQSGTTKRWFDRHYKSATIIRKSSDSQRFVIGYTESVQGQIDSSGNIKGGYSRGGCFLIGSNENFRFTTISASSGTGNATANTNGTFPNNEIPADPQMPTSAGSTPSASATDYGTFYNISVPNIATVTDVITESEDSGTDFNCGPAVVLTNYNSMINDLAKFFNTGEGTVIDPSQSDPEIAGMKKIPNSIYPNTEGSTEIDYPDWWAERTETVNGYDEDGDITYMPWLPVNIFQPTGDDPSDYSQSSSQDGTITTDDEMVDIIDGIDESIESDPDASEQTNPQEQVYPNPNPQPSPSTPTITPVTPTVDVSDGESPDPTSPILTTAITSGLAHIYNPTLTEVKAVGRKLWTLDFVENLKKIFVDPMDGIVGFLIIYATPKTGERKNIVLGIYDTEVQSKIVTNQYVTIDCGTIAVDEYFNDARDYSPYTNVSLYLPFIGVVELYADDVINSHVNIKYHVDVLTGTCLATVKVSKGNASAVVYQYPGNCGVQIPLTSMNYSSIITSLFSVGISAVGGAALGTAKAVGRRLAGAAYGAARAAAINASSSTIDVQQSGSIGSNAGAMGIRNPYFIIRRPVTSDAYAYNMQYGYPANKWVLLENMKGFTRIKSIHLDSLVCTDEEKEMIDSALKEGVVF